jgi:hypothetical protein
MWVKGMARVLAPFQGASLIILRLPGVALVLLAYLLAIVHHASGVAKSGRKVSRCAKAGRYKGGKGRKKKFEIGRFRDLRLPESSDFKILFPILPSP